MATHSSVLAWRIPGSAEPGGLPSMGSHRVGHDWSNLAAAAAGLQTHVVTLFLRNLKQTVLHSGYTNLHSQFTYNNVGCFLFLHISLAYPVYFTYIEEIYKKDLNELENHDSVVTHLEPDILECEVKWALGSITTNKASGGDGIPAELFPILKVDAVNELLSLCQQIWKTQQWPPCSSILAWEIPWIEKPGGLQA